MPLFEDLEELKRHAARHASPVPEELRPPEPTDSEEDFSQRVSALHAATLQLTAEVEALKILSSRPLISNWEHALALGICLGIGVFIVVLAKALVT